MRKLTREEYIEAIYALQGSGGKVRTGQIAGRMGVRPPSVTEMLAKLQSEGMVEYEPYLGASLTRKGCRLAKELDSRHRDLAEFLTMLGVDPDKAQADACLLEHQMSRESADALRGFVERMRGQITAL